MEFIIPEILLSFSYAASLFSLCFLSPLTSLLESVQTQKHCTDSTFEEDKSVEIVLKVCLAFLWVFLSSSLMFSAPSTTLFPLPVNPSGFWNKSSQTVSPAAECLRFMVLRQHFFFMKLIKCTNALAPPQTSWIKSFRVLGLLVGIM